MSSSLKTRLIMAAVAIPLLFAVIFFLPHYDHLAFAIVVVAVNAIGTYELHHNILKKKIDVPFTGYLAILLPLIELINSQLMLFDEMLTIYIVTALLGFSFFVEVINGAKDNFEHSLTRISGTALTLCYPSLFMVFGIKLCSLHSGPNAILVFLACVFGSDSLAYFTGMLFGKNNRGIVKCSPNKSLAGFIGGTFGIALLMALLVLFVPTVLPVSPLGMFVLAFATAVFGTFGDLFESMLKRSAGIKDSGTVIPGRGGMLDCIDSISTAVPIFVFLYGHLVG